MFTTRRSFVKTLSLVAGMIPLPGVVKHLCTTLVPEEQTLEDAEDILRGLIARCVNGPIDEREAKLVGSFLSRMKPTPAQLEALANLNWQDDPSVIPYSLRFITHTVRGMRGRWDAKLGRVVDGKPWFEHNFRHLNPIVMPQVVDAFPPAGASDRLRRNS